MMDLFSLGFGEEVCLSANGKRETANKYTNTQIHKYRHLTGFDVCAFAALKASTKKLTN
jgi:hypothetical protein